MLITPTDDHLRCCCCLSWWESSFHNTKQPTNQPTNQQKFFSFEKNWCSSIYVKVFHFHLIFVIFKLYQPLTVCRSLSVYVFFSFIHLLMSNENHTQKNPKTKKNKKILWIDETSKKKKKWLLYKKCQSFFRFQSYWQSYCLSIHVYKVKIILKKCFIFFFERIN